MIRKRTVGTSVALDLMQFGIAQWFFGNLYEAVVKIPERLAADTHRTSVLGPGSPVRYYAPIVPVTTAGAVGALAGSSGSSRRWLLAAAACWGAGVAMTAYLVRRVNLRVVFADEVVPAAERDALIRMWYRVNVLRTAAAGAALFAAHRAGIVRGSGGRR